MIADDLRAAICALNTVRRVVTDPALRMALAQIADALTGAEMQTRNLEHAPLPPHWLRQFSNPADWPENVTALRRGMV